MSDAIDWQARAEAAEARCADLEKQWHNVSNTAAAALIQRDELRVALKPFSEEAAAWADHRPDGEPLWISLGPGFDPMPSGFSINDLYRARAALAEGESHE